MGTLASRHAQARALGRLRPARSPELKRLVGLLRRRATIAVAVGTYELGLATSGRVDGCLKELAAIKTAALIGCPF